MSRGGVLFGGTLFCLMTQFWVGGPKKVCQGALLGRSFFGSLPVFLCYRFDYFDGVTHCSLTPIPHILWWHFWVQDCAVQRRELFFIFHALKQTLRVGQK